MRIGFVTDEISPDVQEAIHTGLEWGIHDYELRVIDGKRVPDVSENAVAWLQEQKDKLGFRITAISPGTFKDSIEDTDIWQRELRETLPASLRLAQRLDCKTLIIFGFKRAQDEPPENRQRVLQVYKKVAAEAALLGITVAIENEPGFWCDTGANTAAILAELNIPNLRVNWDPANAFGTAEAPFPDGYEAMKPFIVNLHIKDTPNNALSECVPVGEGKIDWPGQLQAIVRDGILDLVVIETHCLPLKEKSLLNLQRVRAILEAI